MSPVLSLLETHTQYNITSILWKKAKILFLHRLFWWELALITVKTIKAKYALELTGSYKDEQTMKFRALKKSLKTMPGVNCSATLNDSPHLPIPPLSHPRSTIKKSNMTSCGQSDTGGQFNKLDWKDERRGNITTEENTGSKEFRFILRLLSTTVTFSPWYMREKSDTAVCATSV